MKLQGTLLTVLALTGCATQQIQMKTITLKSGIQCLVPVETPLGLYKGSETCKPDLGAGGKPWLPVVGHNYSTFRSTR